MSILIVDSNAIGYAAHNTRPLSNGDMETQAIFQSLMTMKHLKEKFTNSNILSLWDDKAQWRLDLFPKYKAQRDDDPEKAESRKRYKVQVPYIRRGLELLGTPQVICEGFEADDLAGFFVRRAEYDITLITGDKDWLQLVGPGVSWYDPRTNRQIFCDESNFEEVTGYKNQSQFLQAKAIEGDTSDNINGIPKLGPKACAGIMQQFGGVVGLVAHYRRKGELEKDDLIPELRRHRKALNAFCADHMPLFKRNLELMNLRTDKRDVEMHKNRVIRKSAPNWDEFRIYCAELGFASIAHEANFKKWQKVFS